MICLKWYLKFLVASFQIPCLTPCPEIPSASSLVSVLPLQPTLYIHAQSQLFSGFFIQMYGEGAALSLLSGLEGNILRLHFLTGQTGRNDADVSVTVQKAERQRESFSSAISFSLNKFLRNILQVCVLGVKELEALMTAHFCLSAPSFRYFHLTSIRQQTLQQTERSKSGRKTARLITVSSCKTDKCGQ